MQAAQDAQKKPTEQTFLLLRWMAWLAILGLLGLAWTLAATPLKHDDIFWHLQTGQWIALHGQIPHQDPFSYTRPNAPWITHEWLFAALCHVFFKVGKLQGLVFFKQLLVFSIFATMLATVRREVDFLKQGWLWPLLCLVLCALTPFFILRASLVTSLCLALLWFLLQRDVSLKKSSTWWFVGGLFLFWGNLHSGVIFGFVLLGCLGVESLWSKLRAAQETSASPSLLRVVGIMLIAVVASLLNPNGMEVWLYPWYLNRFFYHSGIQFDLGIFAAPTPLEHPFFFLYLLLGFVALWPFREKLRSIRIFEAIASVLFLFLALRSNRFVFHFMLLSLPWCARLLLSPRIPFTKEALEITTTSKNLERKDEISRWSALLASCCALAVIALAWLLWRPELVVREPLKFFPAHASVFLKKEKLQGRVFTHQNEGGFYGWALQRPIFWDGRNLLFSSLVREYLRASDFSELEKRYQIEILIINYTMFRDMKPWLSRHSTRWTLVYWDDQAAVYVKNLPKYAEVLRRHAYRYLRPFGDLPQLHNWAKQPILAQSVRRELARAVEVQPQAQLPHYLRGLFALYCNELPLALQALQQAANIRPKRQVYLSLSYALQRLQRFEEARTWLQKAQRLR